MSDNRALTSKLTRVDKAAILLLSLGETDAAQVLLKGFRDAAPTLEVMAKPVGSSDAVLPEYLVLQANPGHEALLRGWLDEG